MSSKVPTIEIVTHCWSGDRVPIYHKLLAMQIKSIVDLKDSLHGVSLTICCSFGDSRTGDVIDRYLDDWIRVIQLTDGELFRRAIGRNKAALSTEADVVWFTDVDHLFFGYSLIEAAKRCIESEEDMVFPNRVMIHKKHDYGDELIENCDIKNPLESFDETLFYSRKERKAIGGLQIVKGDYCRRHGYLDGTRWVNHVGESEGFRQCICDVPFRKQVGEGQPVSIPDVFRIRHSRCGRDGGTKDHGTKTRDSL